MSPYFKVHNWYIFNLLAFPNCDRPINFKPWTDSIAFITITWAPMGTICLKVKLDNAKETGGHLCWENSYEYWLTSQGQSLWASRNFAQQSKMHWFESHSRPQSVIIEHYVWLSKCSRATTSVKESRFYDFWKSLLRISAWFPVILFLPVPAVANGIFTIITIFTIRITRTL